MFGVSVDGPEAVLILEYCAGGLNIVLKKVKIMPTLESVD
jgi:hypothetical protein